MGILKKILGESIKESTSKLHWIPLTDLSQLDQIAKNTKTVSIFKHSTRCGTSSFVKRQFQNEYDIDADLMDVYYLDVLAHRPISNELEERLNVRHESPQLLVIKNDKVIAHDSHGGVNQLDLKKFI